jgi:hypothetical protein
VQQAERPDQLDQRDALHGLAALETLQRRPADPRFLSHLGLSAVALQAMTLKAVSKLREHCVICQKII